ncbi:MAG: tetratricopeptide repeat protein [Acidobacteriota bacterium]|nr:tetratricopeptide repeat protein [Acidobacteriota bacterium]
MLLIGCAAIVAASALVEGPRVREGAQALTAPVAEAYYLFLRARNLEGEGDIEGAIAAYTQAAQLAPGSADIRAELAGVYARQNRGADARAEALAALAIEPANREAHRILGFVFSSALDNDPAGESSPAALENARKAASHFEAARDNRPGDPAAELTLGRLYVLLGESDRAIAILRNFLLDQPGYTEAVLLLADAHAGKGEIDEAIAVIERVAGAEPGPGAARAGLRLTELYERSGRWGDAASVYERLIAQEPRMAAVLRPRRATALVNAGNLDAARALLREMTAASPQDAGLWFLASQAELRAGELGDAEASARRVIAIDPKDHRGASALADVFIARREFPRALDTLQPWLDQGASLTPEVDEAIGSRAAHVFGELGRHDRAAEVLDRLAKRMPDDGELKFELGAAFERARRHGDAERVFREIVAAEPSHALALNYLGYMLADRGERLEEAVSLITRALAIEPDNPSYHDSLGWAYFKQKRYELAERHLAKAVAGAASNSIVQDHHGDALFALKRYADAIAAWQQALGGDRADVDASQIERKIARAKEIAR